MNKIRHHRLIRRITPWLAGASLAVTHISASANCTVTREGRCSSCGSCAVALIVLVTWAVLKNNNVNVDAETNCKNRD